MPSLPWHDGKPGSYGQLPMALHVPVRHTAPAQQISPEPPHAVHWLVAFEQASPELHQDPPTPGQHGSPVPPQPTQTLAEHTANGAVQSTPPPQQAWPIPPHVPMAQAPFEHVPWPPPHMAPEETHAFVV